MTLQIAPADVLVPIGAVLGALVVAVLVAGLTAALVGRLARRSAVAADLARRCRRPLRAVLLVVAAWVALHVTVEPAGWVRGVERGLAIATIGAVAWLAGALAFVLEDASLHRYADVGADDRHARRVRTQVQLLRRITVAALVVCAIGAALLTFPQVRVVGASLFASAGLLSVVAGLAAQGTLGNLFAGLQLTFTDGIRVDDVVVVAGQWGRIEEITLTYIVVHTWDERRLILPSTHFTTTPFENWTRRAGDLLGTVELDVDWTVPIQQMRDELNRLLAGTDLWDGRVGVLQVTDAIEGRVRVRALASAKDAPTLFDLRCHLREGLVTWLVRHAPSALPHNRTEMVGEPAAPAEPEAPPEPVVPRGLDETQALTPEAKDARLFTGSIDAVHRSRAFLGPGEDALDERERTAQRRGDEPPAGRHSDAAGA